MFSLCSHLLENQLLLCNVVSNIFPWRALTMDCLHPVFNALLIFRLLLKMFLTADLPSMYFHLVTCQRISCLESALFRTKRTEVTEVLVDICVPLSIGLGWELLFTLFTLEYSRR